VAVGRAIVRKPKVFLFDEPLSNLDAKLRVAMRAEISKLHRRLGATIIYVTHDQVEAMTMADRIFIMHNGALQQTGMPLEVYGQPANRFVAGFIGSPAMNFIEATLVQEDGAWFIDACSFRVRAPETFRSRLESHAGRPVIFGVRRRRKHRGGTGGCGRNPGIGDLCLSDLRGPFRRRPDGGVGVSADRGTDPGGGPEDGENPYFRQGDVEDHRVGNRGNRVTAILFPNHFDKEAMYEKRKDIDRVGGPDLRGADVGDRFRRD
jgi:hypothetical protein